MVDGPNIWKLNRERKKNNLGIHGNLVCNKDGIQGGENILSSIIGTDSLISQKYKIKMIYFYPKIKSRGSKIEIEN